MRRGAIIAAFVLLSVSARGQRPSFVAQPGGLVAVVLPSSILEDARVRRQLGSGLTTTFLVTAKQRGTNRLSGARMEVRYDLWDEVWIVRKGEDGRWGERQRLTSKDALEKWWRAPLRILATSAAKVSLQVDLSVLPFSAAEENDARDWISKSGGVGTPASDVPGLVDVLIGTTIAAKPITTWRWNVELSVR